MRKNEKHVILCLLEVARRGAKFGKLKIATTSFNTPSPLFVGFVQRNN